MKLSSRAWHQNWLVGGLLVIVSSLWAGPSERALSGGATTVFETGRDAFSRPLANLSTENRRTHAVGDSFFNQNWIAAPASTSGRDGLGPLFNARSCSACHLRDGRGQPPESGEIMASMLVRISGKNGLPDPNYGGQLQNRSIPNISPEGYAIIRYTPLPVTLPDGSEVSLRQPNKPAFEQLRYGPMSAGILTSPRVAQAVHGLGLLEAVPTQSLIDLADPNDADGDGISGRIRRLIDGRMGRFGWKAGQPTLRAQAASAFANDIGITSTLQPADDRTSSQTPKLAGIPDGGSPEIDDRVLDRVEVYLQTLAPPARRDTQDSVVIAGERLFSSVGCAACHTPTLRTGSSEKVALLELADLEIHAYTDLLLHDMGEGLADGRPEGEANGREWRTAPLWGMGLQNVVNGHTFLLHDGRARNALEAILWHGGEAANSRDAFTQLHREDRAALLRFLESL